MSKTNFRYLIIATWVLVLANYAAGYLGSGEAIVRARAMSRAGAEAWAGVPAALIYLISYLYFFLFLASPVGLFAFKNWARGLYLAYYALGFALALVPRVAVHGRSEVLFGGLFSLASALVLALVFFSPLKHSFGGAGAAELS